MELYLIRHTAPAVAAGVCYGQADVPVADSFAQEAAGVRARLAGIKAAACYSSPLTRCRRLAEALAPTPILDARLQELSFGAWEMRSWDTIPRAALNRWGEDYIDGAPPGGESYAGLHARASAFLRELAGSGHEGPVLVVTHAGVIRALLAEVLGLPLQDAFRFRIDCGSVCRLQPDGTPVSVNWVSR